VIEIGLSPVITLKPDRVKRQRSRCPLTNLQYVSSYISQLYPLVAKHG